MIFVYLYSLIAFVAYITVLVVKFRIPCSISDSANLFKNGRIVFYLGFLNFIIPMLIYWLDKTAGQTFQFLVFLSCAALCFTAITGNYRHDKTEMKIHTIATIICAVLSQIWIWVYIPGSYITLPIIALAYVIGLFIPGAFRLGKDGDVVYNVNNSSIFFAEMALFIIAYVCIYIY